MVSDYIANLKKKEKMNGGFPDTESMKVALFGQIAFMYEQKCQDIYKTISTKYIGQTKDQIAALLDKIERDASLADRKVHQGTTTDKNLFLY